MKSIIKYKWHIVWAVFILITVALIFLTIQFEGKSWAPSFIQVAGILEVAYLTIAIFLQSKEASEKQFREQLHHLQQLNANQIKALQESTEKQIEALHKTTFDQISSFEKNIMAVTAKLTDNSVLLAEILGRELEKSLEIYGNIIQEEHARYNDLCGYKILRTPEEREVQLKNQKDRIEQIKNWYDYLVEKYNMVKSFLGVGQRKLT